LLPKLPLGEGVEWFIEWVMENLAWLLNAITVSLTWIVGGLEDVFLAIHPLVLIIIVGLLLWLTTNLRIAVFTLIGLFLIYNLELWDALVATTILIFISVLIALVIGVPIGIWMTRSNMVAKIVRPILDFMQTMPAFVYLIPAVMLFRVGVVSGIFATIIFAMPPAVRLTHLGIIQVPEENKEMARAFGASDFQVLRKVELPLALPSLMAGVNQSIMLGISMVVIAAMIGAGGLGEHVMMAVGKIDIANGFESGLAIVILAMVLDSVSRFMSQKKETLLNRFVSAVKKRKRGDTVPIEP
jgi:glycine betaine/proline transport system permease protein